MKNNLSFIEPENPTNTTERGKIYPFYPVNKKDKRMDKRRFCILEYAKDIKFEGEVFSIYPFIPIPY